MWAKSIAKVIKALYLKYVKEVSKANKDMLTNYDRSGWSKRKEAKNFD